MAIPVEKNEMWTGGSRERLAGQVNNSLRDDPMKRGKLLSVPEHPEI